MPQDDATPRQIADRYVEELADLDPLVATTLGIRPHDDRMPDLSPEGTAARDDLARATLAQLAAAVGAGDLDEPERRCATVLRERLEAGLSISEAGEHLRAVGNLFSPVQRVRQIFLLMPTATDEDWAVVGRRMARVGDAYDSYLRSLDTGAAQGLLAAPRQVEVVVEQLDEWLDGGQGGSWFARHVAAGPESLRGELEAAAASATAAATRVRDHLRDVYLPQAEGTPDAVGHDRYRLWARQWTGADLDVEEAYRWGWEEHARLDREMRAAAELVLPGASPLEAMRHLDEHGEAVEGEEAVQARLQAMMDEVIDELDGTHFDLAEPVRVVEAMIAPPGGAAAPYYTRPSMDFSRPGRTWLPTLGATRFPWWSLVSTWYHEGVPGHHLQLAQWVHVAPQLTTYQTSLGSNSAVTEGWALYAETLMDELGYLRTPGERLGYLDAQQMRAVRVIIDIGMHLELEIPGDQAFHPGERWTPELAREFFGLFCGRGPDFLDSELIRYLGMPAQAITYKLGERAWLAGRAIAQERHGDAFDPKAWHMAALSMGSLGLDDLTEELGRL
ncbi:MAG: DUF885 domain-containing protein [Actinomycetota bacterium]|nr:DUF885 domain-containing protein [Actinomycetota bacterium]